MVNNEIATIAELSDTELDLVAAGSLINFNMPVAINIAVGIQNGLNIAILSNATQIINQGSIFGQRAHA